MAAMELLCHLIGVDSQKLSKEENLILEAILFTRLCDELKEILRKQYKNYFYLMRLDLKLEDDVLEESFIRCILNDILASEAYTLPGIAIYTQTPEDALYEILSGNNNNPSLTLSRKIIELHLSIRKELYQSILVKIVKDTEVIA